MIEVELAEIIARHCRRDGPLLPILHEVQRDQGFISEADVSAIGLALNLSRAELSGVVSFYHDPAAASRGSSATLSWSGRAPWRSTASAMRS